MKEKKEKVKNFKEALENFKPVKGTELNTTAKCEGLSPTTDQPLLTPPPEVKLEVNNNKKNLETKKENPTSTLKIHGKPEYQFAPGYKDVRDACELILSTGGKDKEYLGKLISIMKISKSMRFKLYEFLIKIIDEEEYQKACELLVPCADNEKEIAQTRKLLRAFRKAYSVVPLNERFWVNSKNERQNVYGIGEQAAWYMAQILFERCLAVFKKEKEKFEIQRNIFNDFLSGIYQSWCGTILKDIMSHYWENKPDEVGIFLSCLLGWRAENLAQVFANQIYSEKKEVYPAFLKVLPGRIRQCIKVN